MQISQLQYFERVATYQSISKAADELHLSQPAISNTIHRLEEELGYPLFNRVGRQISLNENGLLFYEIVKKFLINLNQIRTQSLSSENQNTQPVNIGMSVNTSVLFESVKNYSQINPNVRFAFCTLNRGNNTIDTPQLHMVQAISPAHTAVKEMQTQEMDFFVNNITSLEDFPNPYVLLSTTQSCIIVSPDHPLAKRQEVTLDELREEKFCFMTNRNNSRLERSYYRCMQFDFMPKIFALVDQHIHKLALVAQGLCVGFDYMSTNTFAKHDIVRIPIKDEHMNTFYQIIYKRIGAKFASSSAADFWDYISGLKDLNSDN